MQLLDVIIVDDEPLILKGLVETFDWYSMGFRIIGSARSGDEALKLIQGSKPDVLVTDILMKNMDGLELISRCQESFQDLHYVVVSAYREFEYAQKACTLGVYSYLLKPLDEDQIVETMTSLRQTIQDVRQGKDQISQFQRFFKEQLHALEARSIGKFFLMNGPAENLKKDLLLFGSHIEPSAKFVVVCLDISASERILIPLDIGTQRFALMRLLEENLGNSSECWGVELPDGRMLLILDTSEVINPTIRIRTALQSAECLLKLHVTAALSDVREGFDGLLAAYQQAVRIFERGSETGAGILLRDIVDEDTPLLTAYPLNIENELVHAIRQNDVQLLKQSFVLFTEQVESMNDMGDVRMAYRRLASTIHFFLRDTYGLDVDARKKFDYYFKELHMLPKAEAQSILLLALLQIVDARVACDSRVFETNTQIYVAEAKAFIERNLQIPTVSIIDVAKHVHLNPVYFGRLFRAHTGYSFKECLQVMRIDKARHLLDTTNQSISEIAEEVGVQSPSYFSLLFKQIVGFLPSDYRRGQKP